MPDIKAFAHVGNLISDPALRLEIFRREDYNSFNRRNSNIEFDSGSAYNGEWVARLLTLGINFLYIHAEHTAEFAPVLEIATTGFTLRGSRNSCKSFDGKGTSLKYAFLPDFEIFFQAEQFPAIEFLSARSDNNGKLLTFVKESQSLRHIGVSGAAGQIIDAVGTKIESIQLSGSKDRVLPISRKNPNIVQAWFHDMRALTDISACAELPNLRRVKFFYCKKITDFSPLLKLSNLEQVQLIGYGAPKDIAVFREMQQRGVKIEGIRL